MLRAQGGLDFLFLLDLPHHDDGCAKARLRGSWSGWRRSTGPTGAPPWTKRPSGPPSRPLSPCRTAPSWPSPGRGPGRACWRPCGGSPLPVADLTCGGNRSLPPPPEGLDGLDGLLDWYAGALLGQIPACAWTRWAAGRSR
ncbi:MAG: hypothetical protein ACLRNQ_19235 [Flavonifractor plautii]